MDNFTPVSAAIGGALIGLSAVLLMVFTGRIAGISGIFAGFINPLTTDRAWRAAFIGGLVAAPLTAALLGHTVPTPRMPGSYIVVVIGGLLVGFGTRLGSGCTVIALRRASIRDWLGTGWIISWTGNVDLSTLSAAGGRFCDRDGNRHARPRSLAGARRRSDSEISGQFNSCRRLKSENQSAI